MPRPTARVLALLELLQAGGTHTVASLAGRLGVDERTVRRYIEHLRELDIPVDAVRGPYGGYRLARHYRLPPLMLTDEEALAVVWALLLSRRSHSGPATGPGVENAMAKVRRVLPAALARRIDAVLETVGFTGQEAGERRGDDGDSRLPGGEDSAARTLLSLAEAARDRRPVTFAYTTHHGRQARRHLQPHGVVAHRGLLYLTGFDVDRQAPRTFRLDRIADLRLEQGTFAVPADVDPVAQVVGPLDPVPWRHEVSVLVRADLAHVRTHIPETLATVTPVPSGEAGGEGWLRVFLRAERLEWVAGTLAMLDRPFVIERPRELHEVVSSLGHRLVRDSRATARETSDEPDIA
jgi:predicted DNA-binding transcriptional regulator YafY